MQKNLFFDTDFPCAALKTGGDMPFYSGGLLGFAHDTKMFLKSLLLGSIVRLYEKRAVHAKSFQFMLEYNCSLGMCKTIAGSLKNSKS